MRIVVVLTGLWLAATQTFSFSNCCQGVFCPQKDNCPPCGAANEGRACCEKDTEDPTAPLSDEGKGPCVHIEPSSDIVQVDDSLKGDLPALLLLPGEQDLGSGFAPLEIQGPVQGVDPPLQRSEAPVPLYLLDRTLLI